VKIIKTVFFILSGLSFLAAQYYFREDFSTNIQGLAARGWLTNYRYGKTGYLYLTENLSGDDGGNDCGQDGTTAQKYTEQFISNGCIVHRGSPNFVRNSFSGLLAGNQIKYINHGSSWNASPATPVGVQVLRRYAWLDPVTSCKWGGGGSASPRQNCDAGLWLFVDEDPAPYTNSPQVFINGYKELIYFYERAHAKEPDRSVADTRSRWGYYLGANNDLTIDKLSRPNGSLLDLTAARPNFPTGLRWRYVDENSGYANTNTIGQRITHDGNKVRLYINPNPVNQAWNSYPNEWCLLAEIAVAWNSNLTFMIGAEAFRFDQERCDADFDNVLLRSVSAGTGYYKYEKQLNLKWNRTEYTLSPRLKEHNAGIGEIELVWPGSIKRSQFKKIIVFSDFKKNGSLHQHKTVYNKERPDPGEILVSFYSRKIKLRFCQHSDSIHNVVTAATPCRQIRIIFQYKRGLQQVKPQVYVNCEKYAATGYSRYATTGRQLCSPAEDYVRSVP